MTCCCINPLGPFAMCEAFPRSDYYGPSAPPQGHRLTTRQPEKTVPGWGQQVGNLTVVPTNTCEPVGRGGAQLCPCGIATTTPQTFVVASEASDLNPHRSSQTQANRVGAHRIPAQIHRVRAGGRLKKL